MGKFCLDTNIFISSWHSYYPIDVFPSLWGQLAARKDELEIIKPIEKELKEGNDDLWEWFNAQDFTVHKIGDDVEAQALPFQECYETRGSSSGASVTDIKLIAYAKLYGKTIATLEKDQIQRPQKKHKYKIPLICKEESVEWVGLPFLLKSIGIKL